MKKQTIRYIAVLGFVAFALFFSCLAILPLFPAFFEQYVQLGVAPVPAIFYAWGSALAASRWVEVLLVLAVFPYVWLVRFLVRHLGN